MGGGGTVDKGGLLWCKYEDLAYPYQEGGLGLRNFEDLEDVFSCRLWYYFRLQKSLWSKFMMLRYCSREVPMFVQKRATDSRVWKRLIDIREDAENHIQWNFSADLSNEPLWKLSKTGRFNTKETWDFFRDRLQPCYVFRKLWSSIVPRKFSILTWRAIKGWIPVDEALRRRNMIIVSKCIHCSSYETLHHALIDCPLAWEVWSSFATMFNVHITRQMTVKQVLNCWFSSTKSKVHIRHVIPVLTLWSLWELRNKDKHREKLGTTSDVINRVVNFVTRLDHSNLFQYKHWKGDYKLAEYFDCDIEFEQGAPMYLLWAKPHPGRLKLNIDGAANPVFRTAGGGGIMRNHQGEMIWGFSRFYGVHSSLYAETLAMLDGLKMSCSNMMVGFEIETDSLQLFKMIESNQGPWHFRDIITSIRRLLQICKAELRHIYREQNHVADFLAKSALIERRDTDISMQNATSSLKARIDLERQNLGYFRLDT